MLKKVRTRKLTSLLIAIAVASSTLPSFSTIAAATEVAVQSVENPVSSVPTGRYEEAQHVTLTTASQNADIYYTLDGTLPNEKSLKYTNVPITLSKTTNLSAIAFKEGVFSKGVNFSYIIKTKEKPLLQFVAMSDVHIGSRETADPRYVSYFDTISSIFPKPDAILVVGDMINDNGNDKPNDHVMVREVFQQNLARKNWTDTKIRMAIGNHDSTVAKVKEHYPADWFTNQPNGYYESEIGGYNFFFLNGNNYNSDTGQRNWLKGRLAELTSDPKNKDKPIFVNVHQPISGTIMDGQQTSNPNLYDDLKNYPQVINFSGHSHLNINDDRSIYQRDFTSVNLGAMSYIESDHGYSQSTEKGLIGRFEFPVSQAQFVEVYADRVEVERVALNADSGDIYDNWTPVPPFNSKGVSAGEKWVIELNGATNEEIKKNFKYTPDKRNKVAPQFNSQIEVNNLDVMPTLHFAQAKDDQSMHHYEIKVIDKRTGTSAKSVNVFANQFFSPIPNAMNIPLEGLEPLTSYTVSVTGVDSYGNRSATLQQAFKTGGTAPELTPIDPATMWNQLVVDMKFEDSLKDDAKDVTGIANLKGNVNYVQGKNNKSVSIPAGNGNYIDLGSRSDLKFGSDSFTVSFWHTGNLEGDQTVISNKNWNSGNNIGWYIGPAVANSMTLNISDGTNRADYRAQSVGNEWHLFTITVDREGKLAKVYVDGVEKISGNIASLAANSINTDNNIIIGADGNKGNGGATVMMDDLKIWKRSLSATEIKALSDSYKGTKLYAFEQLTALIDNATEFQTNSASVIGVTYPKDKLSNLAAQLEMAKTMKVDSTPADIDSTYIELRWALDITKESVIYTFIPKSPFTVESYSSYADNENALASNILDSDESTLWHSKWLAPAPDFPHWVIMDTKETHLISGIRRTSRQNQSTLDFPREFELYTSDQLSDLTDPAFLSKEENKTTGTFGQTWTGNSYKDFVALNKPIQGRYVKFVVNSTSNPTGLFTSMSEIDFTGKAKEESNLNVTLQDLQVNGTTLSGFVPEKLNYTLNVPHSTSVTHVTYTTADSLATVTVVGGDPLIVGDNHVEVTVTAQDGTKNVYTITVTRGAEGMPSNAHLLDLRVNGQTVNGFAPDNLNYKVTVPNSVSVTQVTYTAADPLTTVTVIGDGSLNVGDNLVTVTVAAQDGTKVMYTITMTRQQSESSTGSGNGSNIGTTPPIETDDNNKQPQLPPNNNAIVISDDLLKDKSNAKISLQLPAEKTKVLIPTSQLDLIHDRDLEVVSEKAHVLIPVQVLHSLKKLLPSTSKTGTITLSIEAVAASNANPVMQDANKTNHTRYSLVRELMDISLFITDESGQEHKPTNFSAPVKVAFPVSHDADRDLLGIYRIEPNGSLFYIGGTFNQDGSFIEAQLNHFSQYAVLSLDKSYTDVSPEHWAYKTIKSLSAKHIVKGQTESTFRPSASITRAEYTALLARALGLQSTSQNSTFVDVVQGSWYEEAVSAAYAAGIVTGTTVDQFHPNQDITREEMAAMLVRAYTYRNSVTLNDSTDVLLGDASELSPWAVKYVRAAIAANLLVGHQDGQFKPRMLTTRAESAQAVYNLIK